MSLSSWLLDVRDLLKFRKLRSEDKRLVIYSEDAGSWPHLGPILEGLLETFDSCVCYVTSDRADPVLGREHAKLRSFCVGSGAIRTFFFTFLEARFLVMTMPDLETFHIKRSRVAPVQYVYIFHSLVSTHMIYRSGAFDHFDVVFCAGPHHRKEIRETEKVYGLQEKTLVNHGYGRIDALRKQVSPLRLRDNEPPTVLVAPSWGASGLLETLGLELLSNLIESGVNVILRPHPMTLRSHPAVIRAIEERYKDHDRYQLDVDMASKASLNNSHVMISDWSGAALEFALGLKRPVVFVDVPKKVNNPEYESIQLVPIEESIREKIGIIIAPENLADIGAAVESLCNDTLSFSAKIEEELDEYVYNIDRSASVATNKLIELCRLPGR
jgi:YidC/Oxa1 family membrane protein insertase